jgi:O-antigen ligase
VTVAEWLYVLLIASLPLVRPWNFSIGGHLGPPTDLIFIVAAGAWLLTLLQRKRKFLYSPFYLPAGLYLGALCLSAVASEDRAGTVIKIAGVAYLVALSVLTINLVRSWRMLRAVMMAWMLGTAILAAGALIGIVLFYAGITDPEVNVFLSSYGTLPAGNYPRIRSFFANANMMCNYLNASLCVALIMTELEWLRASRARLLLASLWAAALTTLSPGLGGLFLAGGAWAWLRDRSPGRARGRLLLAAGCGAALLFLGATLISPATRAGPSERTFIWRTTLDALSDHPLLGRGAGQEILQVRTPERVTSKEPHNVWLSVALQSGLVGLAAFTWLVVFLFRQTLPLQIGRSELATVRTGLGLALITLVFYQGLSGSFEDARHLWVLMGLVVVLEELRPEPGPDREPRAAQAG